MRANKIVVLGCGGTGSILIPSLIRYLYSIEYSGQLIFVDGDKYSDTNITRQIFNLNMVGYNKAHYQAKSAVNQMPCYEKQVSFIDKFLNQNDINDLVEENTVVFNCVDNKAARKFVEDRVSVLSDAAHICCGNETTFGQVQIHYRKNGVSLTPTIYNSVPEFNSADDDRSKLSCEELAALPGGGQLICANMMAASLALNYFMQITSKSPVFQDNTWVYCGTTEFDCKTNSFGHKDIQELKLKAA